MEFQHNPSREGSPAESESMFVDQDHPKYETPEYQYREKTDNYPPVGAEQEDDGAKHAEGSDSGFDDHVSANDKERARISPNLQVPIAESREEHNDEDDSGEEDYGEEDDGGEDDGEDQEIDSRSDQGTQSSERQIDVDEQGKLGDAARQSQCVPCLPKINGLKKLVNYFKRLHEAKAKIVITQRDEINKLKKKIHDLKLELDKLKSGKRKKPDRKKSVQQGAASRARSWPGKLQTHLSDAKGEMNSWKEVWKLCYEEENMPSNRQMHPCVELVAQENSNAATTSAIHGFEQAQSGQENQNRSASGFTSSFDTLPAKILIKVLTELFFFEGCLTHALSRLDPFCEPDSWGNAKDLKSSGMSGRFFISEAKLARISLTHDTILARTLLAPLAVNRRWCFYGCSIFYSRNTFAFSSFGELDRFANGIGSARFQRITNVELHWMGGKSPANVTNVLNERVRPVAWLCEMKRLQTLVIFIDESSRSVIRRHNEAPKIRYQEKKLTSGQPNARETRALRHCHGWDFLHTLRGLKDVKLYDSTKYLKYFDRMESGVRDQSAEIDLNRTARMSLVPNRARFGEIKALGDLFPCKENTWIPKKKDYKLVGNIENGRDIGYSPENNDLDKDVKVVDIRPIVVKDSEKERDIQLPQSRTANEVVVVSDDEDTESDEEDPASDERGAGSDNQSNKLDRPSLPLATPPPSTRHYKRSTTPAAATDKFSAATGRSRFVGDRSSPILIDDDDEDEHAKDNWKASLQKQLHRLPDVPYRTGSASPVPGRSIKRERESSVSGSEPVGPRKRQLKEFAYGPHNNWRSNW